MSDTADEDRITYIATLRRMEAETEKFIAEQRKLIAEAQKFDRDRYSLVIALLAALASAGTVLVAFISRH